MNDTDNQNFNKNGYFVIKNLLNNDEIVGMTRPTEVLTPPKIEKITIRSMHCPQKPLAYFPRTFSHALLILSVILFWL